MEAQKQAKEAGTAANIPPQKDQPKQNPIKEETKPAMDNDKEEPAIPKANNDADEVEEIPIAGRTKMTVPKNRNDPEKETSEQPQEQKPETDDHAAAVAELNGILKRAPSTQSSCFLSYYGRPSFWCLGTFANPMCCCLQSLYFPSPTVRIAPRLNLSSWTNTRLFLHLSWWNLISMSWVDRCRRCWEKIPGVAQSRMCWLTGKALEEGMM